MKKIIVILVSLISIIFVGCSTDIKSNISEEFSISSKSIKEISSQSDNSNFQSEVDSKIISSNSQADFYFDNSYAFLGNSIIGDLEEYEVIDDADVYADIGLNVATVFDVKLKGHRQTILDELISKKYKTIFIMFGTNELGWSYPEIFVEDYKELIDELKENLTNVEIKLISLTPITKSQEDKSDDGVNNENIKKYNSLIKNIAKEKNVVYLDVNRYLKNESGYLPEKDSPDGIHLQPECSLKFIQIIKRLIIE